MKPPTRWAFGLLGAVVCSAGCSSPTIGSLSIGLLLPESPDPSVEVGILRIGASWDGGHLEQDVAYADGGVRLDLPTGTPMDLRIEGVAASGGPALWRGEAHGATVPDRGNEAINVFFGKVGAFSHFASVAEMPPLSGTAATSWGAGQVLLTGGLLGGAASPQIWIYDHRQVRVSRLATLMTARAWPRVLALKDAEGQDFLMVAGGLSPGGAPLASVELFRPPATHLQLPPLIAPQRLPGAVSLDPSGRQILVGCGAGGSNRLSQVQVFVPAAAFDGGATLPAPPIQLGDDCRGGQLTQELGGAAAFVSGENDGGIERIGNGGQSVGPAGSAPAARLGFAAIASPQGLLLVGGRKSGSPTDDVNLVGGGTVKLREPRAEFSWLVVPDAGVLIVGGRTQGTPGTPVALSTAEWLDLNTLTSAPAGRMEVERIESAVAQIPGYGAALVVSGEDESGSPVGGLEIYTYP